MADFVPIRKILKTSKTRKESPKLDEYTDDDSGHDFPSMGMEFLKKVNLKVAIFLFILASFIFSDIFVRSFLKTVSNSTDSLDYPNTKGTMIQLTFLVVGYIFLDILVQGRYI